MTPVTVTGWSVVASAPVSMKPLAGFKVTVFPTEGVIRIETGAGGTLLSLTWKVPVTVPSLLTMIGLAALTISASTSMSLIVTPSVWGAMTLAASATVTVPVVSPVSLYFMPITDTVQDAVSVASTQLAGFTVTTPAGLSEVIVAVTGATGAKASLTVNWVVAFSLMMPGRVGIPVTGVMTKFCTSRSVMCTGRITGTDRPSPENETDTSLFRVSSSWAAVRVVIF